MTATVLVYESASFRLQPPFLNKKLCPLSSRFPFYTHLGCEIKIYQTERGFERKPAISQLWRPQRLDMKTHLTI